MRPSVLRPFSQSSHNLSQFADVRGGWVAGSSTGGGGSGTDSLTTLGMGTALDPSHAKPEAAGAVVASAGPTGPTPLSLLVCSQERACVTVCYRHELRSFDFAVGPIGMEVEHKYHRLICACLCVPVSV